ncbi:uncharacterized protein LOC144579531 [Callithrix jacchus]
MEERDSSKVAGQSLPGTRLLPDAPSPAPGPGRAGLTSRAPGPGASCPRGPGLQVQPPGSTSGRSWGGGSGRYRSTGIVRAQMSPPKQVARTGAAAQPLRPSLPPAPALPRRPLPTGSCRTRLESQSAAPSARPLVPLAPAAAGNGQLGPGQEALRLEGRAGSPAGGGTAPPARGGVSPGPPCPAGPAPRPLLGPRTRPATPRFSPGGCRPSLARRPTGRESSPASPLPVLRVTIPFSSRN